ncbi:putative glutathione s-transferase [Phlyctema vagabunda]|uniref:Glutathione s-transferase n=1 Tax=Phlyctema vagabunda TaxID=108571 RepID=A0ABR4PRP3_9HELO
MNPAHICAPCRRRVTQVRRDRILQWYQRATFISLSTPEVSNEPKKKETENTRGNKPQQPTANGVRDKSGQVRPSRNKFPGFSSQAGDVLESLFAENVKNSPPITKQTPTPLKAFKSYKNVDTLNQMIADGPTQLPAAWKFFVEHFSPDLSQNLPRKPSLPTIIKHTAERLIQELTKAKKEDPFSSDLPSVTEITRIGHAVGVVRGSEWVQLMFGLLDGLTKTSQEDLPDYMHELDEVLIDDLLGTWNIMARRPGIPVGDTQSVLNWDYVPEFSSRDVEAGIKAKGAKYGFGYLFPQLSTMGLPGIVVVGLATFFHINSEARFLNGVTARAGPLNSALARIIHSLEIDNSLLHGRPEAPRSLTELLEKNWPEIKTTATKVQSYHSLDKAPRSAPGRNLAPFKRIMFNDPSTTEEPPAVDSPRRRDVVSVNKSLHDALLKRDYNLVNKLWDEVVEWPVSLETNSASKGTQADTRTIKPLVTRGNKNVLTLTMCNYFIMVCMGLRQPHRAIDIWNFMVSKDLEPNLGTWNSMLNGCKIGRNWEGIENVWARMMSMNVKPDEILWVARISGLIACHKIDRGVQALDEMGRLWLDAAKAQHGDLSIEELRKKHVKKALKPTITVVNAAISGLLVYQQQDGLVQELLTWASKLDIQPDVFTYNILLRPLARQGRLEEAAAILKVMQNQGIKPDIATFTTILDETFRNVDEMTPDEQREMIRGTFVEMEALGIKANLHTYSKIIYHLLQGRNGDMSVVNSVMDRMTREGIRPSAFIYTTLVEYHFERNPPDLDGVKSVIDRTRREAGSVDHIFWDRVIEGYARAGDTVSAVQALRDQDATGNRTSYQALQLLLVALAKRGEWDIAKGIAKNVKSENWAQARGAKDVSKVAYNFWAVVAELGLLKDEQ